MCCHTVPADKIPCRLAGIIPRKRPDYPHQQRCFILVGEQSNAYRILLRYDRKSRHRRIKKQRRYERLAATSQFRTTTLWRSNSKILKVAHFWVPIPVGGLPLSRGRSPYLKPTTEGGDPPFYRGEPTTYRALSSVPLQNIFLFAGRIVVLRITSILWDYYPQPP